MGCRPLFQFAGARGQFDGLRAIAKFGRRTGRRAGEARLFIARNRARKPGHFWRGGIMGDGSGRFPCSPGEKQTGNGHQDAAGPKRKVSVN